ALALAHERPAARRGDGRPTHPGAGLYHGDFHWISARGWEGSAARHDRHLLACLLFRGTKRPSGAPFARLATCCGAPRWRKRGVACAARVRDMAAPPERDRRRPDRTPRDRECARTLHGSYEPGVDRDRGWRDGDPLRIAGDPSALRPRVPRRSPPPLLRERGRLTIFFASGV